MAISINADDKAWIIDCVNDALAALTLTGANTNAELVTKVNDAVTAAQAAAAAYVGPA